VRFLVYLLLPVPLAVLGLMGLHALLAVARPESGTYLSLLGYGYAALGMQSLLFALAMRWLDRRCSLGLRCLLAAVLGGLCGGSLHLLDLVVTGTMPQSYLFVVLGALAGALTTLLASRLPGPAKNKA
jgi:hypothetical protein